jgi:hypothetical protein
MMLLNILFFVTTVSTFGSLTASFFLTLEHHGQHRTRVGALQFVEISNNTPSGSETERADRMVSRGTGVRAAVHGSTGASSAAGYK